MEQDSYQYMLDMYPNHELLENIQENKIKSNAKRRVAKIHDASHMKILSEDMSTYWTHLTDFLNNGDFARIVIEKFWLSLESKIERLSALSKTKGKIKYRCTSALTVDKNEYEIRPHTDIIGKLFTIIFTFQRIQSKKITIILEPDFIH